MGLVDNALQYGLHHGDLSLFNSLYSKGKVTQRKTESQTSSNHWFTLETPGWTQEPGTPFGSPLRGAGTLVFEL